MFNLNSVTPYRDTNFLDILSKSPEKWGRGLNFNETKFPLKFSLKNFLDYPIKLQKGPHSYIYDTNPSWNVINDILYESKLKLFLREELKKKNLIRILDKNFFDIKKIKLLISRYINGKREKGKKLNEIFSIVSFAAIGWY